MAVWTNIYGQSETQYEGCVLHTYERNGYNDSDWYALCWDEEKKNIVEVEYATTRCGGGGHAEIDATEEVLRKVYRLYWNSCRFMFDRFSNPENAKRVRKGDAVTVIRGRKIPKGSNGTVFWIGTRYNQYSKKTEDRIGIEINGERTFLPLEYVEPVNWKSRMISGKKRKQIIRNNAISQMPIQFRAMFAR